MSNVVTEKIEHLIEGAAEAAEESGKIIVRLSFDALEEETFEHFRDKYEIEDLFFDKCAGCNCGNVVAGFQMGILDSAENVYVELSFSRKATEEETIRYIEERVAL